MLKMTGQKQKSKYFVTLYEKYPIFEPAEGGYFYDGIQMTASVSFTEFRKAIRYLRRQYKSWLKEKDDWLYAYCSDNHQEFGCNGRYIGEGWYIKLERKQGEDQCGWHPYC